jgi:hypothetical protein
MTHTTSVVCAVRTAMRCVACNGRSQSSARGLAGLCAARVRVPARSMPSRPRGSAAACSVGMLAHADRSDGRAHGQCRRAHGDDVRALMAMNRAGARAKAAGAEHNVPSELASKFQSPRLPSLDEAPRSASSILAARGRSNDQERPRGGRYFIYRPPQESDVAAGIVEENDAMLTSIAAATLCASTAIPTANSWSPGQTAIGGVRAYRRMAAWTDFPLPDGRARQKPARVPGVHRARRP